MDVVAATPDQIAYWRSRDGAEPEPVVIGGPEEGPDVIPCPALVTAEAGAIHVAFQLDPVEVAELALGGTLWLTTWGPLPIHKVEVVRNGP